MLNDVQRANIMRAINTLRQNPTYHHPAATIIRIAGSEAAKQIAELTAEYRSANEAAKTHGGAMLTAEAADYWQEAQGVLRYARLALVGSDRNRLKETALSRKCERLLESFDARVPDIDKPKFVQYDAQSLGAQDDRWNWTVDGPFPLLCSSFTASIPILNATGEAQAAVLSGLVDPVVHENARSENVSKMAAVLRRIADDRSAEEIKLRASIAQKAAAAEKRERRDSAKAKKEALIAAGDQKATKGNRAQNFKTVSDDFEGLHARPKP